MHYTKLSLKTRAINNFCQLCENNENMGKYKINIDNKKLIWTPQRDKPYMLKYPAVVDKKSKTNSLNHLWDEKFIGFKKNDFRIKSCFTPNYLDCKAYNLHPFSFFDIVLPNEGKPKYFIKIVYHNIDEPYKSKLTNAHIRLYQKMGMKYYFEISVKSILDNEIKILYWCQINKPIEMVQYKKQTLIGDWFNRDVKDWYINEV